MVKKRIHVVIVDNDEANTYLIKKAFSDRGEKVDWYLHFAKHGEEALDYLFRRGCHAEAALPDFILLDWHLPKVTGKQVLRILKNDETLKTLPVLVFSTSISSEDVNEAYDGHANGYIPKPADMDGLYAVIEGIERFWVHTAHLPRRHR